MKLLFFGQSITTNTSSARRRYATIAYTTAAFAQALLISSSSFRVSAFSPSPLQQSRFAQQRNIAVVSSLHPTTTSSSSSSRQMSSVSEDQARQELINCPTITLRNGIKHPAIGFGTYKVGFIPASASSAVAAGNKDDAATKQRSAKDCVLDALNCGYRFLECAEFYGNEVEIGKAIIESGIPREELFLCSKVWTTTIEKGPDAIRAQLEKSLRDLQTDYLDLYLIHWPVPGHHVEAYKTLLEIQREQEPAIIRGIGVSNYALEDYLELKKALNDDETLLPLVNQIEINPFLHRQNTIRALEQENVVMQSYRSLRDGKAMNDSVLLEMASRYDGRSVAQILGRWCVQNGYIYMPKSVKRERMMENARVFDFTLNDDDMNTLNNHLTSRDNLETFEKLYRKCVNRDTSRDGTMEGVKMDITID